jgi:long-chain acyl-CoA synthetase
MSAIGYINAHCNCTEDDRVLAQIELSKIFGLLYCLIWPLSCGACICVGRGLRHIDADTYYYDATILPANPSMAEYLKKIKGFNDNLKNIIIGGAPCPYHLYECLRDRDINVSSVYGTSESTGCIAINYDEDGSYEPFADNTLKLSDDGEILLSGGCVMKGYYNDEVQTERKLKGGYLHTGDYGRINSSGRLIITKRNPAIISLPTGEKICRNVINREIESINGIAESYIMFYDEKLIAVISAIDKSEKVDRFKRKIDKYNDKKGYRWEIQKVVLLDMKLPRKDDGSVDEEALEKVIDEA